jgi:hypothetical protein
MVLVWGGWVKMGFLGNLVLTVWENGFEEQIRNRIADLICIVCSLYSQKEMVLRSTLFVQSVMHIDTFCHYKW